MTDLMTNRGRFLEEYRKQLLLAAIAYPSEYTWPISSFDIVYGRMVAAFDRGSYSKDGRAFRATCKALGIRHTYAAIREFVSADRV
jgi:hypothetical protein